jgi:heme/copper-type cytochrome/quinol oxidase subunit 2
MNESGTPWRRPAVHGTALAGFAAVVLLSIWTVAPRAQSGGQVREFTVVGNDFAFSPARLEVRQNDVVKVTFRAADIAHSFTIDAYRIAKRAGAGQTIVFEFRADQADTFPIYCSLTADERCKRMKGELVVKPQ